MTYFSAGKTAFFSLFIASNAILYPNSEKSGEIKRFPCHLGVPILKYLLPQLKQVLYAIYGVKKEKSLLFRKP